MHRRPSSEDVYLFHEGSHFRLWEMLGARTDGNETTFAVWAPAAKSVSVVCDANGWQPGKFRMDVIANSGVWVGTFRNVGPGSIYKYAIETQAGQIVQKADPVARLAETPPRTGSVVWQSHYLWNDASWMADRPNTQALSQPLSIYEVHLGSFRRIPEQRNRVLTYRELAPWLVQHCQQHAFTHVEFLPLCEHPFDGSWGYQTTGYFASTSRFGTPDDLKYLVDTLHQAGIGVILDWVPAHFPTDEHGLGLFDGTHLYEHADPRRGFHPDWTTYIFNYGRHEVRSFLISSAAYFIEEFHLDGIRVDGVASMLYRDYSRKADEWIPNEDGGRENWEAVVFLKRLNEHLYGCYPGIHTIAEESTAWPGVTTPTDAGGLGFGLKWDMGWMHDTLSYFQRSPVHRKFHHNELTFRAIYQSSENYVMPLSHDEVVHGKGSLLQKMAGDEWQRFANLRLLYSLQWSLPGKKLLFMGNEFAQEREWSHETSLDWHLYLSERHAGLSYLVRDLNLIYREWPALHERDLRPDSDPRGFEWVVASDAQASVLAFLRYSSHGSPILAAFNFTEAVHHGYRVGVPRGGEWRELFCSDAKEYGGSGVGNLGARVSEAHHHGQFAHSISLTLPPLGAVFLAPV